MSSTFQCYQVTAFKWGHTNDRQYTVCVVPSEAQAEEAAVAEHKRKEGKYGVQVLRVGAGAPKLVRYLPSSLGEHKPTHNFRAEMFQRVGQLVHDAASSQLRWKSSANGSTPEPIEVPAWLLQLLIDEEVGCRVEESMDAELQQSFGKRAPDPTSIAMRTELIQLRAKNEVTAHFGKAKERQTRALELVQQRPPKKLPITFSPGVPSLAPARAVRPPSVPNPTQGPTQFEERQAAPAYKDGGLVLDLDLSEDSSTE